MSLCIVAIWYCYQSRTPCTPRASEHRKRSFGLGKKNWMSYDLNAANWLEDIACSLSLGRARDARPPVSPKP